MFLLNKEYWEIGKTKKKGRGVFAKRLIPAGTVIGDYVGKLIKLKDIDFEEERKNMYLMYYDDSQGIYPDLSKPGVHLLNHSCSPTCWIYKHKSHTLVFALRNIKAGEELTISYLLTPENLCINCTHKCYCESKSCRKTMHLTERLYKKWHEFENQFNDSRKKISKSNKKELKPLTYYPKGVSQKYTSKIKDLNIFANNIKE